uniref:hypothetical protein n=1 Tax=Falsiroseomonas oryziterrae TaxID=2911368 RepID=UPI001F390C4B
MRPRLPGLALAGLVLVAGAGALAQAEAERRLDAAIERLRAALGPGGSLAIGGRRVDPVTGQATLTDVVLVQGENRVTIPELRLADVSETRIGRAEALRPRQAGTGPAATTAEAARILLAGVPLPAPGQPFDWTRLSAEALEVETLRLQSPEQGTLRLERLALRDARREGLGSGTLEGLDYAATGTDAQAFRLGRVALEALVLPLGQGDAFDPIAFRAGRIAVENLALRDPDQDVVLGLSRFDLQDWIPGRQASLTVERLETASRAAGMGQLEARLARLAISGVDGPGTVAAVLGNRQPPDPRPGVPQRAVLEGLEASLDGQRVLVLPRLASEASLENGIAAGAFAVEGLRVIPPSPYDDWLRALGLDEIAGGIELRGSVPRAGGRLEVAPFRIAWTDAATLTANVVLEGMPATPAEGAEIDQQATLDAYAEARIGAVTLALRDQGLLGRILASQARQQRIPEARLREQWAQMALALPLPGAAPPGPAPRPGQRQALPTPALQ